MRGVFDVFFFEKMKIRKKYETNIKTSLPLSKKLYFYLKKNDISVNWKKKHLNIFLSYLLKNDISRIFIIFSICSTSSPGGNQVDGLPPALNLTRRADTPCLKSNTGSVVIAGQKEPRKLVLLMVSNQKSVTHVLNIKKSEHVTMTAMFWSLIL